MSSSTSPALPSTSVTRTSSPSAPRVRRLRLPRLRRLFRRGSGTPTYWVPGMHPTTRRAIPEQHLHAVRTPRVF